MAAEFKDIMSKEEITFKDNFEDITNISSEGELPKKLPRRILHFSDGVLEEYSTDEEEEIENKIEPQTSSVLMAVDSSTLAWGPWFWYQTITVGTKTLQVCDYLGESLANFFGITSPKYQFEIDHYNQMLEEEKERQKEEDLEMGGWQNVRNDDKVVEVPS
uniref:Protein FAM177A1 n=1 Tax=Clastoptera arizonana TaxID=38151 RepID=A0A1B6DB32_9HEMI